MRERKKEKEKDEERVKYTFCVKNINVYLHKVILVVLFFYLFVLDCAETSADKPSCI